MRFFTADTHFGHAGIIEYCQRPFRDVDHMSRELVDRWNAVVKQGDVVYHLGDFSFMGAVKTRDLVAQLMGVIILIQGNHDHKPERFFHTVQQNAWDVIGNRRVRLSHYPYRGAHIPNDDRNFSDRQISDNGDWLLHGHVHQAWKVNDRMINVGVDVWDFAPVSEKQIKEFIDAMERGPMEVQGA